MKILLFTHEQDIDGMGSIIIGKQLFKDFDYITCKTFEVNQKVSETIYNSSIYNYDFIYVTDICIKEPLLTQINNDEKLRSKILVLDHHKSEIDEGNDKYPFVNIVVNTEKGKTSGTNLFYDYLISQGLLESNACLDELVELTRQYDTWEWKDLYNNGKARMLHILFEQLGYERYIEQVNEIVTHNRTFNFSDYQLELIADFERKLEYVLNEVLKGMVPYMFELDDINYRIGFVQTLYQYRNDLSNAVQKNNVNDIDLLGMIITDRDTVSYRRIKDVDVSKVAVYFGGKGHKEAASNPKDNERFVKVLALFK